MTESSATHETRIDKWPSGLSSWCGQYGSQISQVLRPRRSASARSNHEIRKGHISWSARDAVQLTATHG